MRPPSLSSSRFLAAVLIAAPSFSLAACILDLDGLSDGRTSSGGTSSGGSGGAGGQGQGAGPGSGGAAGAAPPCALLDCSRCAPACAQGGCEPEPIASAKDAAGPWAVAIMDGALYWVNHEGGSVARRAPGSDAPEMLTKATNPIAIAAANGFLVWSELDGLWGCPVDQCDAMKKKIFGSIAAGSIQGVAYDGKSAYFTDRGDGNLNGKVLACAPDNCAAPLEIAMNQLAPLGIALSGASLFWVDYGTGDKNGTLYKAMKSGQEVHNVTSELIFPTSVAADDAYVYFTRWSDDGKIFRCPNDQNYCAVPEEVAPAAAPLPHPLAVALSAGRVYWSNSTGGTIMSCPLNGCGADQPITHAAGREGLRGIAVGQTCLFWGDETAGGGVFEVSR